MSDQWWQFDRQSTFRTGCLPYPQPVRAGRRETAFKKEGQIHKGIDIEAVTLVAGELQSFAGLSKKLKDQDKSLGDRIHAIEREQTYYRGIGALVLAIAVAFSVNWLKDTLSAKPQRDLPAVGSASALPKAP
jgi:dCTP deaminase